MKNMEVLIGLLIALAMAGGGFTGGYFAGKIPAEKRCDKRVMTMNDTLQVVNERTAHISAIADSLACLPTKVDTVTLIVTKIESKTDTLILLEKNTYEAVKEIRDNVDTIKQEFRAVNGSSR
jgi:hypothetical protein